MIYKTLKVNLSAFGVSADESLIALQCVMRPRERVH